MDISFRIKNELEYILIWYREIDRLLREQSDMMSILPAFNYLLRAREDHFKLIRKYNSIGKTITKLEERIKRDEEKFKNKYLIKI